MTVGGGMTPTGELAEQIAASLPNPDWAHAAPLSELVRRAEAADTLAEHLEEIRDQVWMDGRAAREAAREALAVYRGEPAPADQEGAQ